MKSRAVISTILAILLCITMLPVSAFAGTLGDVDANGSVESSDARLALRAAVGLDELSEEAKKAADVDFNNTVDATDARLILRAAVGLEALPEMPEPEPEPDEHKYHDFKTVSLTGRTRCSVPGCEAELPAFNDMVNGLKDIREGLSFYTGFTEEISHYAETEMGGILADMLEGEEIAASTETEYSFLLVDFLITKNSFHTKGADFVSALSDGDVKSISIERADTVDFVGALPDSFRSGTAQYDISAIKAYDFPEVYKITLVLPEQPVDITKPVSGESVFDKIYAESYNEDTLESIRAELSGGIDALAGELAGLEDMIKMNASGRLTSSLTVEYFVTADTFTPVAAKYSHACDCLLDIRLTDAVEGVECLTMLQKMDISSSSYYFFNNSFGM